jgi:cytochrome b6-f complex iron-sulfur subunit
MDQDNGRPQEAEAPATESVEHYMRLHEHIERLREDKRPAVPGALSAEDARAYQMAALLRSAAPGAATPDPAFVASLQARIRQELAAAQAPIAQDAAASESKQVAAPAVRPLASRRGVSRRSLLGAGLGAAAAGLAAGVGIGHFTAPAPQVAQEHPVPIVPDGAGIWVAVATVQQMPVGAVKRFTTDAIVGYLRHTSSGFSALSGVCTHMGCLLQWNGTARTYDCPCHGGRFAENGSSAPSSPVWYSPLAQIATRVQGKNVEIYVPPSSETGGGNPAIRRGGSNYTAGN